MEGLTLSSLRLAQPELRVLARQVLDKRLPGQRTAGFEKVDKRAIVI